MTSDSAELERLAAKVQTQQEAIDRLTEIVEKVLEKPAATPEKETGPTDKKEKKEKKEEPINWMRLAGDERRQVWMDLARFVEDLVLRYKMQLELMPCWWKHNDVVEELTALWQIHRATFRPGSAPNANLQWLNTLYGSRKRMTAVFMSCREGHIDSALDGWLSGADRQEFEQAVQDGWPDR
ncbi:hypothetical protein OHR68_00780 [Spirillospora sp. NBC_00431]